jgi:hypothetical protein
MVLSSKLIYSYFIWYFIRLQEYFNRYYDEQMEYHEIACPYREYYFHTTLKTFIDDLKMKYK